LELDNKLYQLIGQQAIRYGNGAHTKHKHLQYHDFFIKRIPPDSRILDVGCANGNLAFDIAAKISRVFIYAIDLNSALIEEARKRFSRKNINYVCGDALTALPDQKFDVILLSNVLEHLTPRTGFLKELKNRYHPGKFLIRVPIFERDWRVPLKKELGIEYRLDKTHRIEYRQEEFQTELKRAGLEINHFEVRWGEIWSEAV